MQPQMIADIDHGQSKTPQSSRAFPPAARNRAVHQDAMKFAANARNIFVHHVEPILELRRKEKLASGTTKKKFYFNAARLWAEMQTIDDLHGQRFFWNQKSVEMKLALKKKTAKPEEILENAGFVEDWWECRRYAEMAVGWYLGEDVPGEFRDDPDGCPADATKCENPGTDDEMVMAMLALQEKLHDLPSDVSKLHFNHDPAEFAKPSSDDDHQLLDILPSPFQHEPKMMYGQFAHADYTEIRHLDVKQRAARLRQLADLFDTTGKVLFYYYAYPHIWKDFRPLQIDETVATRAQNKWKLLGSKQQEVWRVKSAELKKLLGNGNVDGLICLELDGMNPEVVKLHWVMEVVLK